MSDETAPAPKGLGFGRSLKGRALQLLSQREHSRAELERKLELNKQSQRDTENEINAKKEGLEVLKSRRVTAAVPNSGQL